MKLRWILVALLLSGPLVRAGEPARKPAETATLVPYRLTDTHHVLLRAKVNGKGPFNFVVDTGCPILLVAAPVGKQIGLKVDAKGWAVLDRLELEGGLVQKDVKARVETPFQIEGMNSMGLAGVELHGLMGYTVLAKYRMQFDFKDDKMNWTPLAFDPPPPLPLGDKAATGGIEMMGSIVKLVSFFLSSQMPPPPQPRGFFGFELAAKDGSVRVERVLPGSPAAQAGLRAGDRIDSVEGQAIKGVADVLSGAAKITAGRTLRLSIQRDDKQQEIRITAGNGL